MPSVEVNMPSGFVTNGMVQSNAKISASKFVRYQSIDVELFGPATTITALTKWLHIVRGTVGTLIGFEAAIAVDATGADRVVTVEVQKSTGGGAFATVLSSPISIPDGTTIRSPQAATISSPSLADGDILEVIVAVSGSASAAATGLLITLHFEEEYS